VAGISSVAEREVDRALRSGEHRALRLFRREQKGDDGDIRCLSLGIRLDLVAGGEDECVFEHCSRKSFRRLVAVVGDENVDVGAGQKKAGDANDFV
jgi:hypothetical protein